MTPILPSRKSDRYCLFSCFCLLNKSLRIFIDVMSQSAFHEIEGMDSKRQRYPCCIVWTPIPVLTWLFPFIGHMGICTSAGVIRDFAGPYYVSEDDMAFGNPTRFWQLDYKLANDGQAGWDRAVVEASEEYKKHMHNLCCDNCHSHVAFALNLMRYGGSSSWNMVKLCFLMLCWGRFVSFSGFLKTWLPFIIIAALCVTVILLLEL